MTAAGPDLLRDLRQRGVRLSTNGNRLVVDAPRDVLTDDDRASLRAEKKSIIQVLATGADCSRSIVCYACRSQQFWLSIYGVTICGVCHPPASSRLVTRWIGGAGEAS